MPSGPPNRPNDPAVPNQPWPVPEPADVLHYAYLWSREHDAAAVGRFESEVTGRTYPRLQISTLAELFQGKKPDIPYVDQASVKRAKREDIRRQDKLL